MNEQYIKNFRGVVMGFIRTEANGDQTAYDFETRQILGHYVARYDHTTNFYGQVVAKGNTVVSFIYENAHKYD